MDQPRRCTATSKRTGEPCGAPPCIGLDKCATHCGLSKAERKARAEAFLAEQAARKAVVTYGLPRDISPTDALLEEVRYTAGHVAWLREQVQALEAGDLVWGMTEQVERDGSEGEAIITGTDTTYGAKPNVWLELYYRERKHLLDVTKAAISVGIEERRVRLAEAQGQLVAEVIRRILGRLSLNAAQNKLVPVVVPEELRRVAASMALN
jgi:hypothetical protein